MKIASWVNSARFYQTAIWNLYIRHTTSENLGMSKVTWPAVAREDSALVLPSFCAWLRCFLSSTHIICTLSWSFWGHMSSRCPLHSLAIFTIKRLGCSAIVLDSYTAFLWTRLWKTQSFGFLSFFVLWFAQAVFLLGHVFPEVGLHLLIFKEHPLLVIWSPTGYLLLVLLTFLATAAILPSVTHKQALFQ